jgi:hypothetical protein
MDVSCSVAYRLPSRQQHWEAGMKKRLLLLAVGAAVALVIGVVAAIAAPGPLPPPTGERTHAQSQLEPVFNAENSGEVGYINTPDGTQHPVPSNPASWSPIYLPVYPTGSTIATAGSGASGPLDCEHFEATGTDNCPDHGNTIAGLAKSCPAAIPACSQAVRNVYAGGVAGHDHVMDFPGGADWNVAWEPIIVLFTNVNAANTRLLTDTQIDAAIASHNAIAIPLPGRTFHCSLVSDSVWALSTAVPSG